MAGVPKMRPESRAGLGGGPGRRADFVLKVPEDTVGGNASVLSAVKGAGGVWTWM